MNKEKYSESIDFNKVCRIKGKPGLWTPATQVNKAKMLGMRDLFDITKHLTCKETDLICLGHFAFYKNDGSVVKISVLIDNLQAFEDQYGVDELSVKELATDSLMKVMLPDYDEDKFKGYHAEWVLKWYRVIMEGNKG